MPPLSNNRGQITVFLSLIFLLLMSCSFVMIEGVREYMTGALCEDALEGAAENVLANYDRPLFERYHLFFLDPREKKQIRKDGMDYLDQYCDPSSFFGFTCRSLSVSSIDAATDHDGKLLRHEMREWMKYGESSEDYHIIQEMYDAYGDILAKAGGYASELRSVSVGSSAGSGDSEGGYGTDYDGSRSSGSSADDGQTDPSGQEEATTEVILWKSIRETLNLYTDSDLLYCCLDSDINLSTLQADLTDCPSGRKGRAGEGRGIDRVPSVDFKAVHEIASLFPSDTRARPEKSLFDEDRYLMEYIEEHFHFFAEDRFKKKSGTEAEGSRRQGAGGSGSSDSMTGNLSDTTALKYEVEYMINGSASDTENLRRMTARLFILRFLLNYDYARNDSSLWEKAGWIAYRAAGQDDMPANPEAGRLLLTGALAYGQTLIDLRQLLSGEKTGITPSSGTWEVTFDHYEDVLRGRKRISASTGGVSYKDYLHYFLMAKSAEILKCGRIMDLMQINVRLSEKDFRMQDSLFSFRWRAGLSSAKWFPSVPGLQLVSDTFMKMNISRTNSY